MRAEKRVEDLLYLTWASLGVVVSDIIRRLWWWMGIWRDRGARQAGRRRSQLNCYPQACRGMGSGWLLQVNRWTSTARSWPANTVRSATWSSDLLPCAVSLINATSVPGLPLPHTLLSHMKMGKWRARHLMNWTMVNFKFRYSFLAFISYVQRKNPLPHGNLLSNLSTKNLVPNKWSRRWAIRLGSTQLYSHVVLALLSGA